MSSVFGKLNLKDQKEIVILNPPESFELEIATLRGVNVVRDLTAVKAVHFALAFVIKQKEVDTLGAAIGKKAEGDAIVWFAYPKQTSKKYKAEIDRDRGWNVLGEFGFEAVRMVAIDEDWSAKRYRRAQHIKVLTRDKSWAMSKEGKAKAGKK